MRLTLYTLGGVSRRLGVLGLVVLVDLGLTFNAAKASQPRTSESFAGLVLNFDVADVSLAIVEVVALHGI